MLALVLINDVRVKTEIEENQIEPRRDHQINQKGSTQIQLETANLNSKKKKIFCFAENLKMNKRDECVSDSEIDKIEGGQFQARTESDEE